MPRAKARKMMFALREQKNQVGFEFNNLHRHLSEMELLHLFQPF